MKVLFVSNDLTHHLVPFFKALFLSYGKENCVFAVLQPSSARIKMGFPEYFEPWVFFAYEHTDVEYLKLWSDADIIITRVWDRTDLIENALKCGKPVFYASERWYRPPVGMKRLFFPRYLLKLLQFKKLSKYPNFYYLAMGYYAGIDFKKVGLCKNRIFNFGYFTPHVENCERSSTSDKIKLIWVGNMLTLKRVIDLLAVYKELEDLYNIELELIGEGVERSNLESFVADNHIRKVTFSNYLPNNEVKQRMIDSDIYVFPSSGYEGWGAVINEAMQTKCAVVASKETGAARSMIIDGKNGLTFPTGNRKELKKALVKLLEDRELMNRLKEEGYKSITEIWSANEAGNRFTNIVDRIQKRQSFDIYQEGPMQIIG